MTDEELTQDAPTHREKILCPSCKTVQEAEVLHTLPWWSFVHFCVCGYTITESEWEKIE